MTRRACGIAVALLLFSLVSPVWSQEEDLIYSPRAASPGEKKPPKDSILVRKVPVKKGDTLSRISRKYSGHGTYYSQILLFNNIKNPNLIYAGKTLKVPVTKPQLFEAGKGEQANIDKELSSGELKPLDQGKQNKKAAREEVEKHSPERVSHEQASVTPPAETTTGRKITTAKEPQLPVADVKDESQTVAADATPAQKLFEQAVRAYRQDDCRTALVLLDRFLTENPASALAADASLYKAECYLKLSK